MEEKLKNFVQSDYYIKAFEGQQNLLARFNIFAAIFGTTWFLYRKMWLFALLYLVVSTLLLMFVAPQITILFSGINGFDIGYWLVLILNRLFTGFIANNLYFWHAKNKIKKIDNKHSGQDTNQFISKRGGTSVMAVAIPIGILVCLNFLLLNLENI